MVRVIADHAAVISSIDGSSNAGTYKTRLKIINGGKHDDPISTGHDLAGRRCSFYYAAGNSIGLRMIVEANNESDC
jgi:hypothetical protein